MTRRPEDGPDTPRDSGTRAMAPVRARIFLERAEALKKEIARCSDAGAHRRALVCQRLRNDCISIGQEMLKWELHDPGPIKRAEVMNRWVSVDHEWAIVTKNPDLYWPKL